MRILTSVLVCCVAIGAANAQVLIPCNELDQDENCASVSGCDKMGIECGDCVEGVMQWRCCWFCEYGVQGCEDPSGCMVCSYWMECDCSENPTPCDCLLTGSQVSLADGSTKRVEEIRKGDVVLSFDERTSALSASEVVDVFPPLIVHHYFVINGTIRVTENHPFLSDGDWVKASELQLGDPLTSSRGHAARVSSIERVEETAVAHNFKVHASTYVAEGVVVHNKENCNNYVAYPPE